VEASRPKAGPCAGAAEDAHSKAQGPGEEGVSLRALLSWPSVRLMAGEGEADLEPVVARSEVGKGSVDPPGSADQIYFQRLLGSPDFSWLQLAFKMPAGHVLQCSLQSHNT